MPVSGINRVAFIGAGTMGCYNALIAALAGYEVLLYDRDEGVLQAVPERLQETGALLAGAGLCDAGDLDQACERIRCEEQLSLALKDIDLVSESVFEQIDIKRAVLSQLDELCAPEVVITSNSSMLRVSAMEGALQHVDRFAALHTHLGSPLIDIVPASSTRPEVLTLLESYANSIGGVALLQRRENPGYVLNAMLGSVLGMALQLRVKDIATVEDIDRAWMLDTGGPMGPFGMLDLFGLPLVLERWQDPEGNALRAEIRPAVLELLQGYVQRDALGLKSGHGFYDYPHPAYQDENFLGEAGDASSLCQVLLRTSLLGAAILVAAADVADPAQIDMAWSVGTGLAEGPFKLLGAVGTRAFADELAAAEQAGRFDADNAATIQAWLAANREGYFE